MNMDTEVVYLYIDDIIPNRFQPREVFDEQALKELSLSIKEHGVIQPIIVRKIGDKYEIIAGERRYKASIMAGLTKIPAIIRNLDDKEAAKVALLENLQRKDLTSIEEARTYKKILDLDQMTQEELGKTMGKSQAAIANKLRLLSLPDEVQEALLNDQISERHARSLLNLHDSAAQVDMLHKIISTRMTVRELDNEIRKLNGEQPINSVPEVASNPTVPKVTIQEPTPQINPEPTTVSTSEPIPDPNVTTNSITEPLRFVPVESLDVEPTKEPITPVTSAFASPTPEVDINQIKSRATDIIPPKKEEVNLDELLKVPESAQNEEKDPIFDQPYKFVPNVNIDEEEKPKEENMNTTETPFVFPKLEEQPVPFTPFATEPIQIPDKEEAEVVIPNKIEKEPYQPFSNTASLLNEYRQAHGIEPTTVNLNTPQEPSVTVKPPHGLKDAIMAARELKATLERQGFVVDLDEMDFENTYQITFKIDKNN